MNRALAPLIALTAGLWLAGCGDNSVVSTANAAPAAGSDAPPGTAHRGAPQRKNGWWEFKSETSTGGSMGSQNLCVTEATEAKFSAFDQITQERLIGTKCSKADFRQTGSTWAFETACDTGISAELGGGIVTNKGTISGDIHTKYEIRMTVTQAGSTVNGVVKAAWKSACPAGSKPGDLAVNGATMLNLLED